MATKHRWLLAEELRVRADAMESIADLVEQLGHTLDFFEKKGQEANRNNMSDLMVLDKILQVAITEMFNLIDKLAPAQEMVKTAILPIAYLHLDDDLCNPLKRTEESPFYCDFLDRAAAFNTFAKLKDELLKAFAQFNRNLYFNYGNIAETFNQMLERYKQEYAESLRYYVDDICSVAEAKTQLRKDYQHSPAVQSWNHEGRDIERVFRDLRLKQVTEQELLPLIEYIAKYEALDECKKDTPQPAGTIVHGNYIEHQNVEQQYNN